MVRIGCYLLAAVMLNLAIRANSKSWLFVGGQSIVLLLDDMARCFLHENAQIQNIAWSYRL